MALLDRLAADPVVRGVVLISGKPDNFVAGADINEFVALRTATEASTLARRGQELVDRVESLGKPVVAAIHGACIVGGLEVALGCQWRVASDHRSSSSPRCSWASCRARAGAPGCRASSGFARRST